MPRCRTGPTGIAESGAHENARGRRVLPMQGRRCLPADPAPVRRSNRGKRDGAAAMAVTIQIVAKRKLAPGGGGVLDRRLSASRLGTVTAIEAIVRQNHRRPSNGATGGGGRCCCLTPIGVTSPSWPLRTNSDDFDCPGRVTAPGRIRSCAGR